LGVDKLVDINDASFIQLKSTGSADLWGVRSKGVQRNIIEILNKMKIFDPACGSGAFPMGMLQLISQTYDRLIAKYDSIENKHVYATGKYAYNKYESKLNIIKRNLYGSDIEPMAIEIARLRCWLSLIIEEEKNVQPLPNLDFNFVCSNTLLCLKDDLNREGQTSLDLGDNSIFEDSFNQLRDLYFNAHTKKEKDFLKEDFRILFDIYLNNEFTSKRVEQLKTWNPFDISKPVGFFDSKMMFDFEGFDIVIANPPYVSVKNIDTQMKKRLSNEYYAASGRFNLFGVFIELGINLLNINGVLSYIVPEQIYSNYDYRFIREIIISNMTVKQMNLFSERVFDAAVDTTILISQKNKLETDIKIIRDLKQNLFKLEQRELNNYPFNIFPAKLDKVSKRIIEKILSNSTAILGDYIEVQQGIIYTGQKKTDIFKNEKVNDNYKKSLDGRDISKYSISWNDKKENKYIEYSDKLHRAREERIFTTVPKIVFPRKSRLITCALDYEKYYALNTAYVVLSDEIELEYIIAILNSKIIQYYYSKLFFGWQITIPAIETIPFLIPDNKTKEEIIQHVKLITKECKQNTSYDKTIARLNNIVYDLFKLSHEERIIIEEFYERMSGGSD